MDLICCWVEISVLDNHIFLVLDSNCCALDKAGALRGIESMALTDSGVFFSLRSAAFIFCHCCSIS